MSDRDDTELRELIGLPLNDRYLLRDLLGSGGFGGVYMAEQHVLGRPVRTVACKVSRRTGITEQTAGELFADVLQLAGAMEGMTDGDARRHLVHVYDGGIARHLDGRAFLVMEFVPGRSLADEFKSFGGKGVPPRMLLKWVRQTCVALHGLHTQLPPLIHRDLKPDNVLLGADGTVRVIDFGLAARMLEGGQAPGTVGTIQYMAPETAAGASIPASDLYSLGLVLYEGLTGRYAYEGLTPPFDLPSTLHGDWFQEQKRKHPLPQPSALDASIPRKLDDLVVRCLELRPADRFRSADEVIAAIDALENGAHRAVPGEGDLEKAQRLRDDGDAAAAVAAAERGLGRPALEPGTRYALLRMLAAVHESRGAHFDAARRLAEAYELAGVLHVKQAERCDLLTRAERGFRSAGNLYQAERFAQLRQAECGGR